MLARITIALLFAVGCSGGSSTTRPDPMPLPPTGSDTGSGSATGSGDTGSGDPSQGPTQSGGDTGKIGQKCGTADACLEGTCETYYGIAGPRGPAFKSCEIKCTATTACPAGKKCISIADGPGQVCR